MITGITTSAARGPGNANFSGTPEHLITPPHDELGSNSVFPRRVFFSMNVDLCHTDNILYFKSTRLQHMPWCIVCMYCAHVPLRVVWRGVCSVVWRGV